MRVIVLSIGLIMCATAGDFKQDQLKYKRVREAYQEKESQIKSTLTEKGLDISSVNIYLRVFKQEKKLELWATNISEENYSIIKEYKICRTSGKKGPKRKEGDLQIPEGFYHINVFNPSSSFHLSLCINYPNKSDRVLSDKDNPGSNICIHGSCVTIGCVPITDDEIKELYIYCVEARNNGQIKIPVTFFPCKPDSSNFEQLKSDYRDNQPFISLWSDLKLGYDYFNETKKLPGIAFNTDGSHQITKR